MAKLLKPHRGTKTRATTNNILLSNGELFCAYNASTNGNGAGQIYIGDGATSFSSLKPFIQDPSLSSSTFTSSVNGSVPASGGGTTKYLRADGTWQVPPDTDTKVTAVGNHYTPTTNNASSLSISATGATAAWSIDVVKGVTIKRDAKGHVTGLEVTSGKIPAKPTYTASDVGALSTNGGTITNAILFKNDNYPGRYITIDASNIDCYDESVIISSFNRNSLYFQNLSYDSNMYLSGTYLIFDNNSYDIKISSDVSTKKWDIIKSDTWDGTNTSLKTAVTNKLDKSGGTMTGDILLNNSTSEYYTRIGYDNLQFNNSSYSLQIATPELNKDWDIIRSNGWNNSIWTSLNSYLGGIGSTFWTKSWTATSSNAANAQLTQSVDISPGNYLLIGSSPGNVSAELPIALTTNANLNIFPPYANIKTRTVFIFHIQAGASVSNVYLKTAASVATTYSNIDQGGFRLIKLG